MSGILKAVEPARSGAEQLLRALSEEGVDLVFGYPGGAIMPVYDALVDSPIRHILTRHEQGAGLAAIGYARATGKVGVVFATSGPGATNLVTALADAYLDSVPLVAITGQVATHLMGTDAFQEVDIFGITLPVVKHSFIVRNPADIATTVVQAFRLARTGRPGPVLIDLPKDMAVQPVPHGLHNAYDRHVEAPEHPDPLRIQHALQMLRTALRPVLYIGGGVLAARAVTALRHFAEVTAMPAVCTLKGLGTLPSDHPYLLGMLGMHGSRAANLAVQECDMLVCAGARFDDRATGQLATFAPRAKVIHLDTDAAEVGKLRATQAPVLGDMNLALAALTTPLDIDPWRQACATMRQEDAMPAKPPSDAIFAPHLITALSLRCLDRATFYSTDVGQHQMWAAQHCVLQAPEQFLTSGGLGTMGFGVPAAIGAQLARPDARVICFTGDGSIMMNVQELATIKRYDLPIKIVLFDNQTLGMVRQWQELFFEERYSETDLSDNPDFVALAAACRIPGQSIRHACEVDAAIERLLTQDGPFMLHVQIDRRANVWPLVPPGKSNAHMMKEG